MGKSIREYQTVEQRHSMFKRSNARPQNANLGHKIKCERRWGTGQSGAELALHGDIAPSKLVKQEKIYDRVIQGMALNGATCREIAEATNRHEKTISQRLRQPFAREAMLKAVDKTVKDELKGFLESTVMPQLKNIEAMASNEQLPPNTRLSASQYLVDRFLGKPTQPVENKTVEPTKLTQEELDREAAKVLNQLGASSTSAEPPARAASANPSADFIGLSDSDPRPNPNPS